MAEFSGKNVKVTINNMPFRPKKLSYEGSQDKKPQHVMGQDEPISIVSGRKSYKGDITLLGSEFNNLMLSLPDGKDPLDLKFDMVVVYFNEEGLLVTDILKDCNFTSFKKDTTSDTDALEVPLPFTFSKLVLNAK